MKLSKSSWHYKLHLWFSHPWKVPKNLCGYFWKTVWYSIAFIPVVIIFIPFWVIDLIVKEEDRSSSIAEMTPVAIILDGALAMVFCMIAMWAYPFSAKTGAGPWIIAVGASGWLFAVVLAIAHWMDWASKKSGGTKRQKKPNIAWEYIKAKKNKYCPIIEWEEEQ